MKKKLIALAIILLCLLAFEFVTIDVHLEPGQNAHIMCEEGRYEIEEIDDLSINFICVGALER